jgi:hypothetical protein
LGLSSELQLPTCSLPGCHRDTINSTSWSSPIPGPFLSPLSPTPIWPQSSFSTARPHPPPPDAGWLPHTCFWSLQFLLHTQVLSNHRTDHTASPFITPNTTHLIQSPCTTSFPTPLNTAQALHCGL